MLDLNGDINLTILHRLDRIKPSLRSMADRHATQAISNPRPGSNRTVKMSRMSPQATPISSFPEDNQ